MKRAAIIALFIVAGLALAWAWIAYNAPEAAGNQCAYDVERAIWSMQIDTRRAVPYIMGDPVAAPAGPRWIVIVPVTAYDEGGDSVMIEYVCANGEIEQIGEWPE